MNRYLPYLPLLTLLLVACAGTPAALPTGSQPPAAADPLPVTENRLRIYNWETYIDPAILESFAELFNVTIEYDTFDNPDELLAAVRANPAAYDLIVPPDYMVPVLRRGGFLAPLRRHNIPNMSNIAGDFVSPPYDPANRYCAPYQWGTMGIGYNIRATQGEINSWGEMFMAEHAGRILLLDDMRNTLGIVLLHLGYSPNSTNATEVAAARDFLLNHGDLIAAYAPDDGQDLLLSGEADIVFEWSGDIMQVSEVDPDIRYVIPEEGSLIWTDNICVTSGAPNPDMAEAFINYILDGEVGAALSNYIRFGSPNQAALPMINPEDRNNPVLYPPPGVRDRLFYLVDLGPQATQLYERAWSEIQTRHGR